MRRRWRIFALAALLGALWFGFLELRGLFAPDEGRYAEIPREMLVSGDWITPRLNGLPYFEKPPLQYWITAAIFAVTEIDEWSSRLWPAVAGLLGVIVVGFTARRLYSRRAAWMAAGFMISCTGYFLSTQFITLDMSLTAFLTCALCAFVLAQSAVASDQRRRWMLGAWLCCALAVLTKGLIGLVLPALAVLAYVLAARDTLLLRRLHLMAGVAVLAVVVLPWFIAVEVRNPGFAQFFFIQEHWERFTSPGHRRTGPWWYFLPIALVALTPWLPAVLAYGRTGVRVRLPQPGTFDVNAFLWCWIGVIFVFFSLSSSKLPAYIMPAFGAVALAVAEPFARRWRDVMRITGWAAVAAGVTVLLLAGVAGNFINVAQVRQAFEQHMPWLLAAGVLLSLTGISVLLFLRARRPVLALVSNALGVMLACQVGVVMVYQIDAYFSAERLIERLMGREARESYHPEIPFYSVQMFDHSVPFYLGRTVILVGDKDELAWGVERHPELFVPDLAEFSRRWKVEGEAFAIMRAETYAALRLADLPMRLLDNDGRRYIVARR